MLVKQLIQTLDANSDLPLHIMLPTGELVPNHFHITEVGRVQKNFIDCGGVHRELISCVLQVWTASDIDHRLTASKLSKILKLADDKLLTGDLPIEIEYGKDIASHYMLVDVEIECCPKRLLFVLTGKQTNCLAPDRCGVSKCGSGCC